MALTETYCDPAIAGNSGTGTIGDPYGDVQYALNTMTRDSTNGDRLNVKAGTGEVLTAALSLATYGTPTATAPLVFQGYTAAAGDGGIGEISGNASVGVMVGAQAQISFIDMKLGNTGTAQILTMGDYITLDNVEFHTSSNTTAGITLGTRARLIRCLFRNTIAGAEQAVVSTNGVVWGCLFSPASGKAGLRMPLLSWVGFNAFYVAGASASGLYQYSETVVVNNSFYGDGSSSQRGIVVASSAQTNWMAYNNIFANFSGTSAVGFHANSGKAYMLGNNFFWNCTTNVSSEALVRRRLDDISLTANPFTDPTNLDFTPATEEMKSLAYPTEFLGGMAQYLDGGAVQIAPSAAVVERLRMRTRARDGER